MTLDGFLTFLTIIVAVYAVMPAVRRLQLNLKRTPLTFISVVALFLVLYFQFFSAVGIKCPNFLGETCRWLTIKESVTISAPQISFLVVCVWMLAVMSILYRPRLRVGSIASLEKLTLELTYRQRYSDVVDLLEPHILLLRRAVKRQSCLMRLHDSIRQMDGRMTTSEVLTLVNDKEYKFSEPKILRVGWRAFLRFLSKFSLLVPSGKAHENAARSIFRILHRDAAILSYVSKFRPEFGIKIMSSDVFGQADFSYSFLQRLIEDRNSVLFAEIRENQSIGQCQYSIPEHNRLLHFLFHDARIGEKLSVWRPIGDFMERKISKDGSNKYPVSLNQPASRFDGEECWNDEVFVGLVFFDVMVRAAACQGVKWHMWLYYIPVIIKGLVASYDESENDIDPTAEFPTKGSFLIYSAVNQLCSWINIMKFLPDNSPHRTEEIIGRGLPNDNIPYSAANALSDGLKHISASNSLSDRFKNSIYEIVLRSIRDLRKDGDEGALRAYCISAILRPNRYGSNEAHVYHLRALWENVDTVLRFDLDDFQTRLFSEGASGN